MSSNRQAAQSETGAHDRYPGARSFRDDPIDSELFFGRDSEVKEFTHKVLSNRLLVLFGKSGLGKTSLLQAGTFPKLRNANYLPLKIRLNRSSVDTTTLLSDAVAEACKEQKIDYTPGRDEGWWEFFKTASFWKGNSWLTPVIILDQFEEIFTLQNQARRQKIAAEIGQLVNGGIPERVREKRRKGRELEYSEKPPEIKIVISLREEYVGALQELFPQVSNILNERVRLSPMSREHAELAVITPAAVEDNRFKTAPFEYQKETLDHLFEFLCNNEGEIEPFQLQVLCQHIEGQVQNKRETEEVTKVGTSYLGDRKQMESVLQDFYRSAINKLPAGKAQRDARELCEFGLLSEGGFRESLSGRRIKKEYGLNEPQLDILVDARLIRREPHLGGYAYELTHDSLAKPVMRNRPVRLPKRFWYVAVGILVTILTVATAISWKQYTEAEKARLDTVKAKEEETAQREIIAENYRGLLDKTQQHENNILMLKDELNQARILTNTGNDQKIATLQKKNEQLNEKNELLSAELQTLQDSAELLIDKNTQLVQAQSAEEVKRLKNQIVLLEQKVIKGATNVRDDPSSNTSGIPVPKMVTVPAGSFRMGSSPKEMRKVAFKRPFEIGQYEVTFEEYDTFAIAEGHKLPEDGGWGRGNLPVINVSWHDAVAYTDWLSSKTKGKTCTLPTEAQWEYAARAGTKRAYGIPADTNGSDDIQGLGLANCDGCQKEGEKAPTKTTAVGSFPANKWGLHDMHGNVWEWVLNEYENPENTSVEGNAPRVLRGGSWFNFPGDAQASVRDGVNPDYRNRFIGFRVVCSSPIKR